MRTKRKFLITILSGLACLATAFAFVCAPKTSKTVSAEATDFATRGHYTYTSATTTPKYVEQDDSVYNAVSNGLGIVNVSANPWEKTIKATVFISKIGEYGLQFFGGSSSFYSIPGICVQANKVEVYNRWVDGSGYTAGRILYGTETNQTIVENRYYEVEYGFANDMANGAISGYTIYFKMTDASGTVVVDYTKSVAPNIKVEGSVETVQDHSTATESAIGCFDGAQGNLFNLLVSKSTDDYKVDALEQDEDISYYWNRANNAPITITEKYRTTPQEDSSYEWLGTDNPSERFLAPGFNKRVTFRFQGDASYELGKYCILMGNVNGLWNGFMCAFKFDFVNHTLAIANNTVADNAQVATWAGDLTKAYDVSISVRKVTTKAGTDYGAMLKMDVTEVGTSNTTTLVDIVWLHGDMFEKQMDRRFMVFTGVVSEDVEQHDPTLKCTISAVNPCWNATVTDGTNSTTTKTSSVTLPTPAGVEGKTFIGWACGNTFYKAGETVTLTANSTFTATYAQFGTIAGAAVRVEKGKNGNETGIRFKGYVNAEDWAALTAIDANVEVCMVVERNDGKQVKITIKTDDLYDVEGESYKEFAIVISITADDSAYYSTVYAAKTFVGVTYAGDEKATYVTTDEISKNSVQNIASVILENKDGKYTAFLNALSTEQKALLQAFAGGTQK